MITYQPEPLTLVDWSSFQREDSKPIGAWFSPVEGKVPAWRQWCEWERWSPGSYTHQYRFSNIPYCTLPQAVKGEGQGKVLLIDTVDGVWDLQWKFRGKDDYRLRWDELGKMVSGISIVPYQYDLRTALRWYYPWDVASGCIWKPPEGMQITEMPLDWDGSIKERSYDDDDSWDDWDDSED